MSEFDNPTYFINAVNYVNITYNSSNSILNKIKIYCGNTLPTGYYWCDGNNSTPDLRDFFIYAISSSNKNSSNNSTTYGSTNVTVPAHNHTITNSSSSYDDSLSVIRGTSNFNSVIRGVPNAISSNSSAKAYNKRANGGNSNMAGRNHKHSVNNSDTSYTIGVNAWNGPNNNINVNSNSNANSIQQNSGNLDYNNSNKTGNTGNLKTTSNHYYPQYIKVGFIMKS